MTTSHNPFVLPGFGQTGEAAVNPLAAGLDMMQQTWQHLAGVGGLAQAAVPMNLEDLDRRITELRTVENWLKLNQTLLASSIQALEVQRATIATLKSFVGAAASAETAQSSAAAPAPAGSDAAQQWWNVMQQQFNQLTQAATASMQAAACADTPAPPATPKAAKRTRASGSTAPRKPVNKA